MKLWLRLCGAPVARRAGFDVAQSLGFLRVTCAQSAPPATPSCAAVPTTSAKPPALPAFAPPKLFSLIWPLYLELWLGILVGLAGTVLAARTSDDAAAAFALVNQVVGTLFLVFRIIGAGVSVALTQRLGAQQKHSADAVARAALGAASWLGGLMGLVALLGAPLLLRLMNTPAQVSVLAEPMLRALGPALMFDAWAAVMAATARAHWRNRSALLAVVLMHLGHLGLMLPLMQGWGPLPALGLPGFALALLLSRLPALGLLAWLWREPLGIGARWHDLWRLPRQTLAEVLRIGLPAAAEEVAWRLAFMSSLAVAAQLGATALATHAYVMQVMHGVLLFGAATGLAMEMAIGHLVGAGQLRKANALLRRALLLGLLAALGLALLVALNGRWLLGWFTQDPLILTQGATLLWWTVGVECGRMFNLVIINALRAAGDVRFPLQAGLISMPLVLAGGSWFLGLHLGWGLAGLWAAYAADELLRGAMMAWRWRSRVWVGKARAVRRRQTQARH